MKAYAFAGTISHGTMRREDLAPKFVREARRRFEEIQADGAPDPYSEESLLELERLLAQFERDGYDDAGEFMEELFNFLDERAPSGYYFGSIDGDGCDYGWWTSED